MDKHSFMVAVIAALALALSASPVTAGEVVGAVRDIGARPPSQGVSGAKVKLVPGRGDAVSAGITDRKGEYHIANVPNGDYTVVVDAVGYVPRPHKRTQKTVQTGKNNLGVVLLMRAYGPDAYYQVVADALVKAAQSGPDSATAKRYARAWQELREVGLPPQSKAQLVRLIDQRDMKAKEALPAMKDYLAVSPQDIDAAVKAFHDAFLGKASMPTKASLADRRIREEVVADIVLFQLTASSGSEEQRVEFLRKFRSTWMGTSAADEVIAVIDKGGKSSID
jgi:hypothetical protein